MNSEVSYSVMAETIFKRIHQAPEMAACSHLEIPGAQAIRIPRSRFAPVKKCDDLLALRSDAYKLTEETGPHGHVGD